jgi:hypothetical protein
LTAAGIGATTFDDVIDQDRQGLAGWLEAERAVVVDDGSRRARAAIDRLSELGLPTVVVHPERLR